MVAHVELDTKSNRIVLTCEYYVGISQDCKSIQGYDYDPERKVWTYPARMQTCHALRKTFGELVIGPVLTTWARTNAVKYKQQRALAKKPDSDLARVKESHPKFWEAMSTRPYQRSGAEFLAATGHTADFSEPGLGKTATALASLIQAGVWNGRHLVIVSNKTAIRSTWAEEIKKWTPDAKVYPMPDGQAKREKMLDKFWADEEGARFVVMLPHMLQIKTGHWCGKCEVWQEQSTGKKAVTEVPVKHYEENHNWKFADMKMDWPELFYEEEGKYIFEWDSIVADECHDYLLKVAPHQAKNMPQWAVGMKRVQIRQGGVKLAITGTPMRGKEVNLFGIMHWLDPVKNSSFWGWADAYFEVGPADAYGQRVVSRLRPEMEEAFYDVLDSYALRRTKREVRKELPPLLPQEHWVEMEGEHKRQYEEFEALGEAQMESGVLTGLGTLSEITRLRQLSFGPWNLIPQPDKWDEEAQEMVPVRAKMIPIPKESPKIALVLDMLRERGVEQAEGMKFIIASQWVSILDGLGDMLQELKIPYLMITGRVTGAQRSKNVKIFQAPGGPRIMLLNTKAGGASLTLDQQCDEMFVLDETWIHDDQVQLMGRIDNRSGEIRPRIIHFIRTRDTVEEGIAMNNDDQNTIQQKILDTRRGLEFSLSLIRRSA